MRNISVLIKLILALIAIVAIVAPFTFLKPVYTPVKPPEPKVVEVVKPKPVEQPLHNVQLPDFGAIPDVKEKKRQFFAFIRPSIEDENARLRNLRAKLLDIQAQIMLEEELSDQDLLWLGNLAKQYRLAKNLTPFQQMDQLVARVDEIPTALVLVQAANESAWGTSRFARIGLNFFGIWCYRKGCGMVPRARNSGANHEVEAFKSVDAAVKRYLHNINTNNAYILFRSIRRQLREQDQALLPEILATGLVPYSERGADYVLELTDMLRHNRAYF